MGSPSAFTQFGGGPAQDVCHHPEFHFKNSQPDNNLQRTTHCNIWQNEVCDGLIPVRVPRQLTSGSPSAGSTLAGATSLLPAGVLEACGAIAMG